MLMSKLTWNICILLFCVNVLLFPSSSMAQHDTIKTLPGVEGGDQPYIFSYSSRHPGLYKPLQHPFKSAPVHSLRAQKRSYKASGVIDVQMDITQPSCGYGSGSLVAVASGGIAPYRYEVTDAYNYTTRYNTGNIRPLSAGNYVLKVIDAGGTFVEIQFTLTDTYPAVKLDLESFTPASGCDAKDGSITVKAFEGTPPYQYSWDRINYDDDRTFTGLSYGLYNIFVKDANGCVGIYNSFPLLARFGCSNPLGVAGGGYTCGNNSSINYWNVDNDKGPYTYSLDGVNYQDKGYWEHIGPGNYTVWSKDKDGGIMLFSFQVIEWCDIEVTYVGVDAACEKEDGMITLTAQNGITPYAYSIDGINYQSSNIFSNLAPGYYIVTARDFNNISSSVSAYVYDKCPAMNLSTTKESCSGNDGSILIYGFKGTPPYVYSIDGQNFQTETSFTNLKEGNYTITMKDDLGFTGTSEIYVAKGCLNVIALPEDAGCQGGKITVSAYGGAEPYQYAINGGAYNTEPVFTNLTAGVYTIRVKDAADAEGTVQTIVNSSRPLTLNIQSGYAGCSLSDGSLQLQATGGVAPYTYSINGTDFQPVGSFTATAPGNYTTWVKDANGCSIKKDTSVAINCLKFTTELYHADCKKSNGVLKVKAADGVAPFEFSIDGVHFSPDSTFRDMAPAAYTVTVKAADGSVQTGEVNIDEVCIALNLSVQNAVCQLDNGSIGVSVSGGTAPYQYSKDGIRFQSSNSITDLTAGNYKISVRDAEGRMIDTTVRVSEQEPPYISISTRPASCDDNDGEAYIKVNGAVSPYFFSIDGASLQLDSNFYRLPHGNYVFIMQDARGCKIEQGATVSSSNNLYLDIGRDTTLCEGETLVLQPSSNALNYLWSPSASLNNATAKNPVAAPASSTKYTLKVTRGICELSDAVNVSVMDAPIAKVSNDITICYGESTELHGSGGDKYTWSPSTYLIDAHSATPLVQKPAASVAYQLSVEDQYGCRSITPSSVKVIVTAAPNLFAGNDTSIVMNEPIQLTALDVNNSGFITYQWSPEFGLSDPGSSAPVVKIDRDITYTVKAYTAAGCEGLDEIQIKAYQKAEIYVASAFTPNGDNINDILRAMPVGINRFNYFSVFDRWGNLVFNTNTPTLGWNGSINGKNVATGAFVWKAQGIDFKGNLIFRKGVVTIIQ